jgi:hypothetical protein
MVLPIFLKSQVRVSGLVSASQFRNRLHRQRAHPKALAANGKRSRTMTGVPQSQIEFVVRAFIDFPSRAAEKISMCDRCSYASFFFCRV